MKSMPRNWNKNVKVRSAGNVGSKTTTIFSCQRKTGSGFEPSHCPNLLLIIIKRISLLVGFEGVCLYHRVKVDPEIYI
jgi:hypothetical protein